MPGRGSTAACRMSGPGERGAGLAIVPAITIQAHPKRPKEIVYVLGDAKPPSCLPCRLSHIPCEHERPCGRCKRMMLRCEGTPQSIDLTRSTCSLTLIAEARGTRSTGATHLKVFFF